MDTDNEWGFVTIPTSTDPEKRAIARLKIASEMSLKTTEKPLVITTSGGKDSSTIVELAIRAGIPFEVLHSHTTADAPETVRFVRRELARLEQLGIKCSIHYPEYKGKRTSMWSLIPQVQMPPTRLMRYCCDVLKEQSTPGRMIATGVRWNESSNRAKKRGIFERQVSNADKSINTKSDSDDLTALYEPCKLKAKRIVNPIVDWSDSDVWDFLGDAKVPMNPLYECGLKRVGCVGCPAAGKKRHREFALWPAYEKLYIQAFDRMIEARTRSGKTTRWRNGMEVFRWWMEENTLPGQVTFDDYEEVKHG